MEQARNPATGKIDIVKAGQRVDQAQPQVEQGKPADQGKPGDQSKPPDQGKSTDPATTPTTPPKERKFNLPEAQRNNIIYQKMRGWDPFTFFKKPGIEAGSAEFANGVYDMQQALHVNADGILGDETLVAFYKHNKLREDIPFKESQQAIEAQQAARDKAAAEKATRDRAARDAANGFKTLNGYECIPDDPNKWSVPHGVIPYIHEPAPDVLISAPKPDQRVLTQQPAFVTLDIVVDGKIEFRIENVEVQSLRVWEALVATGGSFARFNLDLTMRRGIQVTTSKGQVVMRSMEWSVP
jgi:hypothetical protein